MPQNITIFSDSVAGNIALGAMNLSERKAIENAAEQAQAARFVQDLEDGYDTLIVIKALGCRGATAHCDSGFAQASAVLMDEATSALDTESEALIQSAPRHQ